MIVERMKPEDLKPKPDACECAQVLSLYEAMGLSGDVLLEDCIDTYREAFRARMDCR